MVAAVQGATVGIGVTLLLHCDLVVAARSARLSMPFVKLGLVPEAASSLLLPRLVGYQRAAEMLLLGEPIDAERAFDIGMVNRIVDDQALMDEARALARKLAQQPGGALLATRRLLQSGSTTLLGRMEEELEAFPRAARLCGIPRSGAGLSQQAPRQLEARTCRSTASMASFPSSIPPLSSIHWRH